MQNLSSTKTLATANLFITRWKKKFILNILKYNLIKNFKLQILIMRCDTFGNPPLSEGQVRTQNF